jgi:Protein of unknwon function (DUF3008)
MPATSKAQQKAAGAALSAKRGETPKSKLKGVSRQMAESMSEDQLEEFAATKRKSLPSRKAAKMAAPKKRTATKKRATAKKAAPTKRAAKR